MQGVLRRALELLPASTPTLVLPAMPIGKSNEHLAFPGTLSLSASTLTALWTDIGKSVASAGVRKMVLFNSHGGQPQVRLRMFWRTEGRVVATSLCIS